MDDYDVRTAIIQEPVATRQARLTVVDVKFLFGWIFSLLQHGKAGIWMLVCLIYTYVCTYIYIYVYIYIYA